MSARKITESQDRPNAARRTLLTGSALGLAAVAGTALGAAQPASAVTSPSIVDWLNVKNAPYSAKGDGVTDDTAAINQALTDAGNQVTNGIATGGVVYMPTGVYVTTSPLKIPAQVLLIGAIPACASMNNAGTPDYSGTIIQPKISWANGGITNQPGILYVNGDGTTIHKPGISNLWIDGSNLASAINSPGAVGAHGISVWGGAFHGMILGVGVYSVPQDGLHFQKDLSNNRSDGWTVRDSVVQTWGINPYTSPAQTAYGCYLHAQDSQFVNVHVQAAQAATTGGSCWYIHNGNDCRFVACRGDQSGDSGWLFDSPPGGANGGNPGGTITLIGCGTENNNNYGLHLINSSATGGDQRTPVLTVGCSFDFDGRGTPSGGGAAMRVEGTNVLEATGCNVTSGGNTYPAYGLVTGTTGSGNAPPQLVRCQGGVWNALTAFVNDTAGISPIVDVDGVAGSQWGFQSTVAPYRASPNPGAVTPADVGYAGWAYDPASLPANFAGNPLATAGVVYLWKIPVRSVSSVSDIRSWIVTAGSGLTSGRCFAGLYSPTGTLIATTADQSTAWARTGLIDMALTGGPYTIYPPFVWAALLFNGTTGPSFVRVSNQTSAFANGKLAASQARYGSVGSGQTALPASITPSSITLTQIMYWAAIW